MNKLEQFLESVYASINKRRDSYLELGLALASSEQLESIVGLSQSPLYRRNFSSVYETLAKVVIDEQKWLTANYRLLADCCERLSGVAVFSGDSTFVTRRDAVTLEERSYKRNRNGDLLVGQESYWTMQIAEQATSWCGVVAVSRMVNQSVTELAASHLKLLDQEAQGQQLYVLDAGHGQAILATFRDCQQTDIVMRLKSNQVFYDAPPAYSGRGRPSLHGKPFKLASCCAEDPAQDMTIDYQDHKLHIQAYTDLHYQRYADVAGRVLRLSFLDEHNKPRYNKPIWLFTTNLSLDPSIIAQAYLWRSRHELSFRFLKQHLSLSKVQSPCLQHVDAHLNLVALAMNLLLASKDNLHPKPAPWYSQQAHKAISQRQAQKQALAFFLNLASPSQAPRPAGKAQGRAQGFKPTPRPRHKVIRKTPKRHKICPNCPMRAPP